MLLLLTGASLTSAAKLWRPELVVVQLEPSRPPVRHVMLHSWFTGRAQISGATSFVNVSTRPQCCSTSLGLKPGGCVATESETVGDSPTDSESAAAISVVACGGSKHYGCCAAVCIQQTGSSAVG
jgi:hypothetical protein